MMKLATRDGKRGKKKTINQNKAFFSEGKKALASRRYTWNTFVFNHYYSGNFMLIFFIYILPTIISTLILRPNRKAIIGFFLGLILGPFGLLIALFIRRSLDKKRANDPRSINEVEDTTKKKNQTLENNFKKCPFCSEELLVASSFCMHCNKDIS